MFENGVRFYTKGTAPVEVNFPEKEVTCAYCKFCKYEQDFKRYSCRLTGDWLFNIIKTVGSECPLIFETEV